MNGDPWQLELTPKQWQQYLSKATAALHANPRDREALDAVRHANEALSVYDEAEAATPSERIRSGVEGGLEGLGQSVLDIPRGIAQTVSHPIQTVTNLPKVPGQILQGVLSDDPSQVARTVGNLGSLLLPFAKAGRAAPFLQGAKRIAGAPGRTVAAWAERPALRNDLLRARLTKTLRTTPAEAGSAPPPAAVGEPPAPVGSTTEPVADDVRQAFADHEAGKITEEDLRTALDFAHGRPLEETPQPISEGSPGSGRLRAGEAAEEIPGTGGRGIAITGPRTTPAPPTAPSVTEVLEGRGTLPRYFRGGQAEQSVPPSPVRTPTDRTAQATQQVKVLLGMRPEQLEAAKGLIPGDVLRMVMELRAAGATPADIP